jgi:putative oxidoreductase
MKLKFILKMHQWSMCFDEQIKNWGGSVLSLGLRIFISWQFLKSGLIKIQNWEGTLSLFQEEYTVPFLSPDFAAYAGTFGELVLPVLLIIGLFSRPAALGLFFVNVLAVISYPQLLEFDCPAAINDHFYWGLILLILTISGAGKVSIDALIQRSQRLNILR